MTQPPQLGARKARIIARGMAESRRHQRVSLPLEGVFVDEQGQEFPCRLEDASPGGGRVTTEGEALQGERITLELEMFGQLGAEVVRRTDEGFSVRWTGGPRRRERLAELLTWAHNAGKMDESDDRGAGRVKRSGRVQILFDNGARIVAEVMDVSPTGLKLRSDQRPHLGERVRLGRLTGEVARYHSEGFALRLDPPSPRPKPVEAEAAAEPEAEKPVGDAPAEEAAPGTASEDS